MVALKRILIGRPISSADEHDQRLSKKIALPVFASDAISSTAYATDEILVVLLLQAGIGAAAFRPMVPIAIVVCVLLAIVVTSYRQTIMAYPSGGGSYIVSRENLGVTPSLVAGAALMVDYILTVSVSVAGGVLAIRTATGFDTRWTVPVCLLCVFVMTVMNLRGVKESGAAFAGPTYFYIAMLVILIATGLYRIFVEHVGPIPDSVLSADAREVRDGAKSLGLLMLLRAFSSGAVALSGVEAVSNGVPAFQKPEAKNAVTTLLWMGAILGSCFLGVSVLASHLRPYRGENDGNGLGLMAEYLYGGKGVMFWLTMIATFMILVLAANTAYAGFPRLSSMVARDGFLPRQFFNKGARLVFSNGVLFLALAASALIVAFDGDISKLIPLYAFGVFTGFTLSQTGMVRHHRRLREPGWQVGMVINGIGAITTGVIAAIVMISKFTEGAWIPVILIPLMVVGFRAIGRHYRRSRAAVVAEPGYWPRRETHTMVVLVSGVNKGVLHGIQYAKSLNPDRIMAVTVASDDEDRQRIERQWSEYGVPIELHTVYSPYRELTRPIMRFIDELDSQHGDDIITVVIPEFVTSWGTQWLHNGSAFALKARLLHRPHTAVVSVPVHLHDGVVEEV
ncbi:MAG TPA: APC family permease [Ilumatobacteraceae bacterium]|nr:APC family permease [Ilumatobacteraceae bacterium]